MSKNRPEISSYYRNEIKRLKALSQYYSEHNQDNSMVNYQIKIYEQNLYAYKKRTKKLKSKNTDDVYRGLNIYYPSYKRGRKIIK